MSFAVPRNLPNFDAQQRQLEDRVWGSSGQSRHTNGGASGAGAYSFGGIGKELPMYKDKPYNYPASKRRRSLKLWVTGIVLLIATWYLVFGRSGTTTPKVPSGDTLWSKFSSPSKESSTWSARRLQVVKAMEISWSGYEKHAWGYDEYHPVSKAGRQMVPPTGLGWVIVDALDTLMLMNLTTQLQHAREWISTTLTYDLDHDVNTFETTIRMLGGFLAAHYLQTEFPNMCPVDLGHGGEDLFLEKATDLAERLLGAFESPSGIPYASVNLKSMKGIPSHADGGASSLAEATSVQLEMKYLAKLTGEKNYWDKVEKVMKVVDATGEKDGLKGIFIHPETGSSASNNIRLGSRGDSYYEYLLKQYLQTSKQEPIYLNMWDESLAGIKKHLITYSSPSNFTVLAERPNGLGGSLHPKMDHLVCFIPGTIALSTTAGLSVEEVKKKSEWDDKKEENLELAKELMKTCWGMYKFTRTGLAPEITYFKVHEGSHMYKNGPLKSPATLDPSADADWRQDFEIKPADTHNLLRPETVESLFYMWRITGDEMYRHWGWEMFGSFMKHTSIPDGTGFSSIGNVNEIPPPHWDNMESFWPAETLKYFFLLFSPNDLLPLDKVVFNTEAHAFPRFELGKLFFTGWRRQPRDKDGLIIQEVQPHQEVRIERKTISFEAVS